MAPSFRRSDPAKQTHGKEQNDGTQDGDKLAKVRPVESPTGPQPTAPNR
jgi:hypothetical protein